MSRNKRGLTQLSLQIKSVIAEIYDNNPASLNIFSEAGFKRNMSILKKSIDNG